MTLLNVTKDNQTNCCSEAASAPESGQANQTRFQRPRYRVVPEEASYRVEVDLPGVPKAGLEITVAEGILTVIGNRTWSAGQDWNPVSGEAEDGISYRLKLSLGDQVNGDSISANLDSGVLELVLAKAEEKKPRRIAVA